MTKHDPHDTKLPYYYPFAFGEGKIAQALADLVPGAKFWPMKQLGHFPVTEDYTKFREYGLPILAEISAAS